MCSSDRKAKHRYEWSTLLLRYVYDLLFSLLCISIGLIRAAEVMRNGANNYIRYIDDPSVSIYDRKAKRLIFYRGIYDAVKLGAFRR